MDPLQSSHLTVVGDALLDVRVRAAAPPSPGADVPAEIAIGPGGQGANVAVRLARAGMGVTLHCALGPDLAGDLLRAALAAEGLVLDAVRVAATGSVVVQLDASGERTMLSQRAPFAATLTARGLAAEGGWTAVSGYALLEDVDALVTGLAAGAGRRALLGCAVPPARRARWTALAIALRPHLVVLNRSEAEELPLDLGDDAILVVTQADRASAQGTHQSVEARADEPIEAVDSTGAGDAFAAGLLAHLTRADRKWPPDEADLVDGLHAGLRLAREVAGVEGAQGAVPSERAGVPT